MVNITNIQINTTKHILSSISKIYKTEKFFLDTKKISNIDYFALTIAENILPHIAKLKNIGNNFKLITSNQNFIFYFTIGNNASNVALEENDIVFYKFECKSTIKTNDQKVISYLSTHTNFDITITPTKQSIDNNDYKKLYYLTGSDIICFPLLNSDQQSLVTNTADNIIIQGVAGSGKTNVCLNKIIWSANQNYSGKVLYTTFSKALLIDTKNKIDIYKANIVKFISDWEENKIVFIDNNHRLAIENRLGIYITSSDDNDTKAKLLSIIDFLDSHIDYKLIDEIYQDITNQEITIATEKTFEEKFLVELNNHQLKNRLEKIKHLSPTIIYKEIYGLIFGSNTKKQMLDFNAYKEKRNGSFGKEECEIIYSLAKAYYDYLIKNNIADNNILSRKIIELTPHKYSLTILDEVQDFTEINLLMFKEISIKMFCVGDALQMINPSYFNFAYLKNLLYSKDIIEVSTLPNNYRNSKKITTILEKMNLINNNLFGTHNFVIKCQAIDSNYDTNAIYINDKQFINKLKNQKFQNFTTVVNTPQEKNYLRKIFPKQEILTITEIKGLERDNILLYNSLSSNYEKWNNLNYQKINHKNADENSVYRYYYNLFYVGISRAKHNVFVYEDKPINLFDTLFKNEFFCPPTDKTFDIFANTIGTISIDTEEILTRVNQFITSGQFDNARFYLDKIDDNIIEVQTKAKIDIFENYVFKNKNKEAGIKLWQAGLTDEAKKQFTISGDTKLIDFLDNLSNQNKQTLDASIVKFFTDFNNNIDIQQLILDILKEDLKSIKDTHEQTKAKLKKINKENQPWIAKK